MPTAIHFQPYKVEAGARERGCFTCTHFQGQFFCQHVVCEHRGRVQVIGRPDLGCAYWMREPGADDE